MNIEADNEYSSKTCFPMFNVSVTLCMKKEVAVRSMSGSAVARLLRLWVRIPPETCLSVVSVVCCQVDVSATG